MLEYQFEVKPKKKGIESEESPFTTEKMGYWDACDFCDELNRKGIHYMLIEINSECNNRQRLTSKLLHRIDFLDPKRNKIV